MAFLIGTDEAGYGPNLGPLVVSASVWRVPDSLIHCDLYQQLSRCVNADVSSMTEKQVAICDSKQLYKPKGTLADLETGVLSCLGCVRKTPANWTSVWEQLAPQSFYALRKVVWYRDFDRAIPVHADADEITSKKDTFQVETKKAQVELCALESIAILPEQFNQMIEELGTKSSALSNVTLDLVCRMVDKFSDEPTKIVCDKHGGRNNYASLLQPRFNDQLVKVRCEGRAESSYEISTTATPIEISFRAKGESFLPSALASMASKYLRELAMLAFNQFWSDHVEGLSPTAGYPVDAKRFKKDIEPAQKQLGISDELLWRVR